jgi:putative membrane protein
MVQETNRQAQQEEAARVMQKLGMYALVRTSLSSERSLMAWMRTSVSLYTFGFSITKFLDYLGKQAVAEPSTGLYRLGFAIICVGILGLVLAALGHLQRLKKMKQLGLPTLSPMSLPVVATAALISIGIAVLIGIGLNRSLSL